MSEYLEDALDVGLRIRFESHFAVCVDCWRDLQSLRQVGVLLAGLPATAMPLPVREALIEARGRAAVAG